MTTVLVNGCSFTDKKYCFDWKPGGCVGFIDWPTWPELLINRINETYGKEIHLENIAVSGNSNEAMVDQCIAWCQSHYKPDVIVLALSEWTRFVDMCGNKLNAAITLVKETNEDYNFDDIDKNWNYYKQRYKDWYTSNPNKPHHREKLWTPKEISEFMGYFQVVPKMIQNTVGNTLKKLHYLILYCQQHNIKLVLFQMLNAVWKNPQGPNKGKWKKELTQRINVAINTHLDCWDELLEAQKNPNFYFADYPFIGDAGGSFVIDGWQHKQHLHINSNDAHPNGEGHEHIAELVWDRTHTFFKNKI